MKKVKLTTHTHSSANEGIITYLEIAEGFGVHARFKLADRLEERGLTVRKCAELTGLRLGTISDLMNGKKSSVSFQHLWVLMLVLGITNLEDLIELHIPTELKDCLNEGASNWIRSQEVPHVITLSSEIIRGEEEAELIPEYKHLVEESLKHHRK